MQKRYKYMTTLSATLEQKIHRLEGTQPSTYNDNSVNATLAEYEDAYASFMILKKKIHAMLRSWWMQSSRNGSLGKSSQALRARIFASDQLAI